MKYITTVGNQEYVIQIEQEGRIIVDDEAYDIDFQLLAEGGILSLLLEQNSLEALVEEKEGNWEVLIRGELYTVKVQDERSYRLAQARGTTFEYSGDASIKSPMPGLIIDVPVKIGELVKRDDKIVILESMKMENELRSPRDGVVTHIYVEPGASVEKDQLLATIGEAHSLD